MVNKKILILIVALVLVISLISYFVFTSFPGFKIGTVEGTTITSLHLESFPAGTQMGPGLTGTETTSFKIDEIGVISGTVTTNGKVTSTIKIFDIDGNFIDEHSCVEIKGTGGFGCSLNIPQQAGKYILELYIENIEVRSLDFEVME